MDLEKGTGEGHLAKRINWLQIWAWLNESVFRPHLLKFEEVIKELLLLGQNSCFSSVNCKDLPE